MHLNTSLNKKIRIFALEQKNPTKMNRLISVFFTLLFTISLQAQVLFVKADANGANTGSSWADAYTDLQDAIAAADYGTEIWVAIGTYKPTQGTNRDAFFELKNGVEIYGGFLGSESELEERDYIHNESILSGDIGVEGDISDNSYTIVYSIGTDENTIIEGFTIQGGNANYAGGDVFDTDPKMSGGGMYLTGEETDLRCQVKHCHFKNNHSDARGGGLFIWSGPAAGSTRPNIFANEFTQNNAGTLGGGFYWIGGTTLQDELIPADSLIFNNNNANVGGGIHITSRVNSALTKIRNCIFFENTSSTFGGGLYFREDSFETLGLEFEGCNFEFNNSNSLGGGIYYSGFAEFKNVTLRDCYLGHNLAGTLEDRLDGGGIYLEGYIDTPNSNATLLIDNTRMDWNRGNYGGAVHPNIVGPLLIEVKNSTFQYNTAAFSGGAIYSSLIDQSLRVSNSYFEGNAANDATGGGIHVQSSDVEVTNCVFNANIGKTGAGIRMINGNVTNCVFYENNALQQGGAIRCSQATIANCIFWENTNFGLGPDIYNNSFPITVESCLFSAEDCEGINYDNSNISCSGNTIFGIDPLFTSPDDNDFSVALNSVVRDAADNSFYPTAITEDYFGNPRVLGSNLDIGVYELPVVSIASLTASGGDCEQEDINIGSINYEIFNGVAPLTLTIGEVEFTTNDISGTITDLAGGTFEFTVLDAVGNTANQSVFIPTLPQPTTSVEMTIPTCSSFTNGVLILSAEGETGPFSILWDNEYDGFGQYGIGGGMYAYTLTDSYGCESTGVENLMAPEEIVINGTTENVLCSGGATGQVTIDPTGGTGTLSVQWSPNPNNETGNQLTDVLPGVYSVTVTDELGCGLIEQLIVGSGSSIELNAEVTDAGCTGSPTGAISITNTEDLNYEWSNEMTGATISGLIAGTYTVTATDENDCESIETYTVYAGAPISFSPTLSPIQCTGETNGSIDLNIENTNGLNFTWSPNANGQTGTFITELAAGTYFLTVTDGVDCPSYAEYTISEPSEIVLTPLFTNPSCLGGSDGTISLFAEGGTVDATDDYSYQISPSLTEDANGLFSGASAGEYQVFVMDANACSTETIVVVEEGDPITINGIANDVNCFNENTGSIELLGTAGSTYTWSPNANGQATDIITGLAPDTYAVTVVDEMGCQGFNEFVVAEPSEISLSSSTENVSCIGGDDGLININASGGTPFADCEYDYTVSPDLSLSSCGVFIGATLGNYTLTATDANGCQMSTTVEVIENEALNAVLSVSDASCPGATNGSVNVEITGGEAPYMIEGETENLGAGDYSIQITDINNCEFTSTFTISEGEGLSLDFEIENESCAGNSDGSVEIIVLGGVPPYTIEGETDNLSAGEYEVTILDSNDCAVTGNFTISGNTGPTISLETTDVSCPTYNDGFVELTITGGMPPYSIVGDTDNLSAGEHEITVSDSNNCSTTTSFVISQPNPLNFDFDIINAETSSSTDGSIFIENITGGTAPYNFEWENGETTEDIINISAGIYNLLITDDNDCSYSFGFEVDYNTAVNNLSSLGWELSLQPNILTERRNALLILDADQNTKAVLHVYNTIGQLAEERVIDVISGRQQLVLKTESLTSGVYFVRLDVEGLGAEVLRLIVVD